MGCSESKPDKNQVEPKKEKLSSSGDVTGGSPAKSDVSEIQIYRRKIEQEEKTEKGTSRTGLNWFCDTL